MNKKLIIAAALCLLPGVSFAQAEKKDSTVFTVVKENPITPVKDQNQSGTCWAYSSLGFLESELLRMGKGEHDLCESFLVYHTYMDRADKAIRTHGDVSFSQGGSFYDAIYCLKNYGIVPQDAMPAPGTPYGDSLFNFNQLSNVTTAYVEAIAKSNAKKINPVWKKDLKSLGLNPDDYVSLTSFTHYPFYSKFIIEVQDNWRWAESYNLPLDEFMEVMDQAVRNGYSFAWGADVSEKGFSRQGIATVPDTKAAADKTGSDAARWTGTNGKGVTPADAKGEKVITQEMRQLGYDNWETTDDHGMIIYGLAKDQNGKEYFMMKNSWGVFGPYKGLWYVSKPYVAYKTMNILINKHAIPAKIAKKLGLK